MGKQIDLNKIEQLRRRLHLSHENASKYQLEVESLARAAATDKAWAKEELDKQVAHIQRLEAENDDLRRSNLLIRKEINETKEAYRNIAKRITNCCLCMQSLNSADGSSPAVPTETEGVIRQTEIRQNSTIRLLEHLQAPYSDRILHRGDSSYPTTAIADTGAINPTAQTPLLISEAPRLLSALLPAGTTPSESNCSSFVTDSSPVLTSRETQPSPVSSCGDSSPGSAFGNAWSIAKGLPEGGQFFRRAGLLTVRPEQPAQTVHRENPLVQSSLTHGDVARSPTVLSEGSSLPGVSSRRAGTDIGGSPLPRASSDVSMQSAPELRDEVNIAVDVEADEQASPDHSDLSSTGSNEDPDQDSDEDTAITVDASGQKNGGMYFGSTGRQGSKAPKDHQRGDRLHNLSSRNHQIASDKRPPLSHHQKRHIGQRLDRQLVSTESRLTASNMHSQATQSPSASEDFRASRGLEPAALGSSSLTMLGFDTQARPTRSAVPMPSPAMAVQTQGQDACHGEEESDVDLKAAIRESYANFALSGQRLRFCYEPQTMDPFSINLNTNWKRRSKLNESIIEKFQQMGSEIATFFPQPDSEKATKKDTDLIRRLCRLHHPQTACGSLKEVVGALRQERDVTKDELNLIEFEIYSTLIVMKSQSESEVGRPHQYDY